MFRREDTALYIDTDAGPPRLDRDVLLATILINLLSLSLPIAMMQIFNRVIPNGSLGTLTGLYLFLIGYIIADALLKIARAQIYLSRAAMAETRIAEQAFDNLFRMHLRAAGRIGLDALAERLTQLRDIGKLDSGHLTASRMDLVFTAVFITVIFALAPYLAMVVLGCVATVAIWSIRVRSKFKTAAQMRNVNGVRRGSFLIEIFRLMPEVKLLGIEQFLIRRYEMLQQSSSSASETLIRINSSAATLSAIIGQVSTGLVSVVGAYLVILEQIGLAELAAAILLAGRTVQPVIQALLVDMDVSILRHVKAVLEEMQGLERRASVPSLIATSAHPVPLPIFLDRVTLREQMTGVLLLRQFSLEIPQGGLTCIQGRSDAPADHVLRVLAGEAEVDEGKITIGSFPSRLSDRTVYLGAAEDLHDGPVIKNLTAYRGRSFEPTALRIGRELGLDRDIRLLPGGYEHVITQDGKAHGSHGLYMKLRLVRALSISASVYLLDRPFAGLDPRGQALLRSYLEKLRGSATVVIANPPQNLALESDLHVTIRPDLEPQVRFAGRRCAGGVTDFQKISA